MKHIIILSGILGCLLLGFSVQVFAQGKKIPPLLQNRLQGKTTLTAIMNEVEKYYITEARDQQTGNEERENEYTHWKRWEWWMSSHLDGNGNFVQDYTLLNKQALETVEQKWPAENAAMRNGSLQRPSEEMPNMQQGQNFTSGPNGIESSFGGWLSIGPTADAAGGSGDIKGVGRFDRIAFHPTNANIIYIGAPTGQLWKTTNGGTSWTSITDGLNNPGVAGIAVSPSNGNVVYLLSGDGDSYNSGFLVFQYGSSPQCTGVYKSTDGGTTWNTTGALYTGSNAFVGHRLAVSSGNGNFLIAATNQGLYRTTNGGSTWQQVRTGEHWDIKFKPGNDSIVYATTGSTILYSTQGGRSGTWQTSTTDFSVSGSGRINLAVSNNPSTGQYVFAICGNAGTGSFTGIFRSTNSGLSYGRRTNTPNILGKDQDGLDGGDQSVYDMGITVKPSSISTIATCGLNVWTSTTGGLTMNWSTKYREGYGGAANKYIHPDVHDVQYNPLNDYLYAATDGGIYRSTDDGTSWSSLQNGIANGQFYSMTMRDSDGNGEGEGLQLLAGAQDNGIKYRPSNGSSTYNHVVCCDGYGVGIAPNNNNTIYMNINDRFFKSTDGGSTYSDPTGGNVTFFSSIAIDYNNPDTVYLGGSSIRRSYNAFTSFTTIATNSRRVLSTCPSNSARLYGSSGTNLIFSSDRASTWTTKSGNSGWPAATLNVNDIEAYPTNSSEVYVCFGGYSASNKVLRSTNTGDIWTNWSGSLPNVPTYGLAVSVEGVYVGTELGVFFRGYSMSDWVPYYNGMPKVPVTELAVNANGNVYASTFGRGMWFSGRRTACDATTFISGVKTGNWYYEASNTVTATMTSPGSVETEVFVKAGREVVLQPGFEVKAGAYFRGYISPCSNGGIPVASRLSGTEETILLPRINEVNEKTKLPENENNYAMISGSELEINITKDSKVLMEAQDHSGKWLIFYPEQKFSPGLYSLPLPQKNALAYRISADGKTLPMIKPSNKYNGSIDPQSGYPTK